MYGVLTDAKRYRQFAATPMRGTIARLLARGGQNPRPQSRCQYAGSLSGMKGVEAIEPVLKKTLLPANDRKHVIFEDHALTNDRRCGSLQSLFDGAEGRASASSRIQLGANISAGKERD